STLKSPSYTKSVSWQHYLRCRGKVARNSVWLCITIQKCKFN
ncbi:transposase, partial [Shigella flexneri]